MKSIALFAPWLMLLLARPSVQQQCFTDPLTCAVCGNDDHCSAANATFDDLTPGKPVVEYGTWYFTNFVTVQANTSHGHQLRPSSPPNYALLPAVECGQIGPVYGIFGRVYSLNYGCTHPGKRSSVACNVTFTLPCSSGTTVTTLTYPADYAANSSLALATNFPLRAGDSSCGNWTVDALSLKGSKPVDLYLDNVAFGDDVV